MPEYAWMYLNKHDSEYASGAKYPKILNMSKFWIWQGFSICERYKAFDYARIYINRVLNISCVLNMAGLWICKIYIGFQICRNMAEYVWIYNNSQGFEYVSYNT